MTNPKKLGFYRVTTVRRALIMLAVDIFGYAFLFPYVAVRRLRGLTFDTQKALRIAVFRLDGIGDLILSEPALKAFRAAFPKAQIFLFVNKWVGNLAESLTGYDEIMMLDAPLFKAFKGKLNWKTLLKERLMIKRLGRLKRFDLAIDLRGDILSIITAYWLGARWFFSRASRGGGFLLTNVIRQPEEGYISETKLNLKFVEQISRREFKYEKPKLKIDKKPVGQGLFSEFMMKIGGDYICLAVSAPYETRCYPVEKWIKVIRLIQREYDGLIVILGAWVDFKRGESIVRQVYKNIYNMAGKFSLIESARCIVGARMFIGNDGGLIHIASAANLPVVQLFGPSNSLCFGHIDPHEHVIHKECPYNPCDENHCKVSTNWCMDRITPMEIFETALPYLNKRGCCG